jgi:NADP-dependent aldehyde dehydrogenase
VNGTRLGGETDRETRDVIWTRDPRTGTTMPTHLEPTSTERVAEIAQRAADAASPLHRAGRAARAVLLEAIAAEIERHVDELIAVADAETGLGEPRLRGELARSAHQFRLFATAIREGSYLEAMIDHADESAAPPAPDLRRMLVPVGPVAVFGSSNFPFAFSVLGGDTASALAAGAPVVVKAHGSHPLTSARSFEILAAAAATAGLPRDIVGIVYGQPAGTALVGHPAIAAVGFTGSLAAATALCDTIAARPKPIPFFGELSSINPVVVTPAAAAAHAGDIARGLFASVTGSAGQLCTKPGVVLLPAGAAGQAIVDRLRELFRDADEAVVLNSRIRDSYVAFSERLRDAPGASLLPTRAEGESADGFVVAPCLVEIEATALADTAEECFGPLVMVSRYQDVGEIVGVLGGIPSSLTATLHVEHHEELLDTLLPALEAHAGRIVFNGYPTGVRVSWAQHHGGPWPATNSQHTSVGVTAMRRFLRPLVWQNAPASALPAELREDVTEIPRRVDGVLRPARVADRNDGDRP